MSSDERERERERERLLDWMVEQGYIKPEQRATTTLSVCRTPDYAGENEAGVSNE